MRILLLCDYRPAGPATVVDHIHALQRDTGHDVSTLSILGDLPDRLDLEQFDAVILHYSLVIANDSYLAPLARYRLRKYAGIKAVFIQDEYRWVNRTLDALYYLKVNVLFTCVPESEIEKVYPAQKLPGLSKFNVLTGYVSKDLTTHESPAYDARTIDVGYRARKISAAYGALGREKWLIADRFQVTGKRYGLNCDISYKEDARLYGQAWTAFIQSCKSVLGVESGASVFDAAGEILPAVEAHEKREPEAPFELLRDRYFPNLDGAVRMNQISPRCFEAAALRTLMILYEGEYSGILSPGRHYVALRKDHSNEEEVIAALRDKATWERITENAYTEIALNPAFGFESFGRYVGEILAQKLERSKWKSPCDRVEPEAFEELARRSSIDVKAKLGRVAMLSRCYGYLDRYVMRLFPERLANIVRSAARGVYLSASCAWRMMATLRRDMGIVAYYRIPVWSFVCLGSTRKVLVEDLIYVQKLSRYGCGANDVAGIPPFSLVYDGATEHLKLISRDNPDVVACISGASGATSISTCSLAHFPIRTVSIELDEAESRRLSVGGEEKQLLDGLTLLMRRHPKIGNRLFGIGTGQSTWLDQLVVI